MNNLEFNDYQKQAATFDVFQEKNPSVKDPGFTTKVLGLCGEAGEVAEKFKKILRDKNGEVNAEDKAEIAKEIGDVLWYASVIAGYLDIEMGEIAQNNLTKLASRKDRNKISGSGDNR